MNKYKAIKINGKKFDEHRIVMEKHLGRKLTKTEVVHHIDGDKNNNDISNLKLFSNISEHVKFHAKHDKNFASGKNKRKLEDNKLKCSVCGILKDLSEFQKQSQKHLGVMGTCKKCRNIQVKAWRKKWKNEKIKRI